jgi:phosphatidylinositol alpha 1,6-mannosyltransferase
VVTESFLPAANDVTSGVCRTLEHLSRRGHDTVVICPGPAPESFAGARVIGVPSVSYGRSSVGLPSSKVMRTLASFAPDVVHLASPFILGSIGVTAAGQLGVPTVAVFKPGLAGFGRQSRGGLLHGAAWRWARRIHEQADLTLAPSAAILAQLRGHSVPRLELWEAAVDCERFTARRRNTAAVAELRARLAPNGEALIGYARSEQSGRDAGSAELPGLVALAKLAGTRLVVIGDAPRDEALRAALVSGEAAFLGRLDGDALADAYAALDIFVDLDDDGAGVTLGEVMASGVPVVAPVYGEPLDWIAQGLNGLLYPRDNAPAMRAAVASLVADPEQRSWMGTAARAGVERKAFEQLGDELIGHYRGVLQQRSLVT